MKKHTKCRMNEICRKPHRDGECERNCYYNTVEVKTNADRIRAMTDEELANFVSLCCGWTCAECPVGKECNGDECFSTWLEWLKQEAEE